MQCDCKNKQNKFPQNFPPFLREIKVTKSGDTICWRCSVVNVLVRFTSLFLEHIWYVFGRFWFVFGAYLVCFWSFLVCFWIKFGLFLDHIWFVFGSYLVCFWIIFGLFLVVFGSVWVKIVKAKQMFRSGANNFENISPSFTNLVFNVDLEINFRQKTNQ